MLGIIGTVVALINFFWAIAYYENVQVVEANFILHQFLGDAPDHIVRLFYITISIFDMVAAALLIAGILMVNITNNCSIMLLVNSYCNKMAQWTRVCSRR